MSKGVQPKDKKAIEETIVKYQGDELGSVFPLDFIFESKAITTKPKKYTSDGVMAISLCRIFVFHKKALKKDIPLLWVREFGGGGADLPLWIKYVDDKDKEEFLGVKGPEEKEFFKAVRTAYKQITYGWSDNLLAPVTADASSLMPLDESSLEISKSGGFRHCYKAWCNLRDQPARLEVIQFIEDLGERGITDLDLGKCPGIEYNKSALNFDLLTVGLALQNNKYFKGVIIKDVTNKDAADALAYIVRFNSAITRISTANTTSTAPDNFGTAIELNKTNKLSMIDLSNTPFSERLGATFSRALRGLQHGVTVLCLANCNVGRAINDLLTAFRINWGMSLLLEELDLTGNLLDESTSKNFVEWIKDMAQYSLLRRLSVANTGMPLGHLLHRLVGYELEFLDLSDNKFEKNMQDSLGHWIESLTSHFKVLRLGGSMLPAEVIKSMLEKFNANGAISGISLDFSRNALSAKEVAFFGPTLLKSNSVTALDLSDNVLKTKGGITLLQSLSTAVTKLNLAQNFPDAGDETRQLCQSLGTFLSSHPSLTSLNLAGGVKNAMGPNLATFFSELKSNVSLVELDVSGNNVGDVAFATLARALRTNQGVKTLRVDNNLVGVNGYMAFRQTLDVNKIISYLDFPVQDFGRFGSVKFREVITEVQYILYRRCQHPNQEENWTTNQFDFNQKWVTPQGNPPDLCGVPAELEEISTRIVAAGKDADMTQMYISMRLQREREGLTPGNVASPRLNRGRTVQTLNSPVSPGGGPPLDHPEAPALLSSRGGPPPAGAPPPPAGVPPPPIGAPPPPAGAPPPPGDVPPPSSRGGFNLAAFAPPKNSSSVLGTSKGGPPPSGPPPPMGGPPPSGPPPPMGGPPPPMGLPPPGGPPPPLGSSRGGPPPGGPPPPLSPPPGGPPPPMGAPPPRGGPPPSGPPPPMGGPPPRGGPPPAGPPPPMGGPPPMMGGPPPPPGAPPPPGPPPPPSIGGPPPSGGQRGALLSSITGFRKDLLKKSETNDRSGPVF